MNNRSQGNDIDLSLHSIDILMIVLKDQNAQKGKGATKKTTAAIGIALITYICLCVTYVRKV